MSVSIVVPENMLYSCVCICQKTCCTSVYVCVWLLWAGESFDFNSTTVVCRSGIKHAGSAPGLYLQTFKLSLWTGHVIHSGWKINSDHTIVDVHLWLCTHSSWFYLFSVVRGILMWMSKVSLNYWSDVLTLLKVLQAWYKVRPSKWAFQHRHCFFSKMFF